MQDLTSGFARDLFIEWAEDEKNSIIFSTRTAPGSLARKLIDNPNTTKVDIEVGFKLDAHANVSFLACIASKFNVYYNVYCKHYNV